MKLLPTWSERVKNAEQEPTASRISYGLKKSSQYFAVQTNFIETTDEAQAMLDFALQRPLSHIGFDTEFGYRRPGIVIDKKNIRYDPTSIRPLLLSLSMAATHSRIWVKLIILPRTLRLHQAQVIRL